MSGNPWEVIETEQVLFLIDAAHKVEEKLLLDWLNETKNQSSYQGAVSHCVVSIADNPDDISTEGLQIALEVPLETLVVPVRVVWRTQLDDLNSKPRWRDLLFGNPRRPSQRKAQSLIQSSPERAQCVIGRPATLQDLTQRYEKREAIAQINDSLAGYVAEQASLALEVAERRLRGSRYKVPRQVSKQVRASTRYKEGLHKIMQDTGDSEEELRTRALPYFKELVATPHIFWQDVAAAFNRWVISLGYEDKLVVDLEKLEQYRAIVREHPTALLWTHKTHMDGITIQSILFEHDFPPPHTMGGINMAFTGVGFLARRAGAIFIRRSFQDKPLYKLVLREYLAYLLEKRFPLTWSFEGTRSRVGKLMPPRYGMLKYVMDAMKESNADNLHIIPVAINYDMNNDVKDYAAEQSGSLKRPESLSWFISYLRRMRQPLGRIYVDFGDPVIVNKDTFQEDRLVVEKTAFKVGLEANRVTPITLTALMSMSLLGATPRAQTIDELQTNMSALRKWAEHFNIQFTSDFDEGQHKHMAELIDNMVSSELINRYDEGPETVYAVDADKHAMASYYRNTIVHHFVPKAIAELALVAAAMSDDEPLDDFWDEAYRLREMFKFEFFYESTDKFHQQVHAMMEFHHSEWQTQINDQASAMALLQKMTPLVGHCSLQPYIEAYRLMADVFARLPADESLDEKSAMAEAFKYGRQAYLQRRISSKASIGQILFKNAYKVMQGYQVVEAGHEQLVEERKNVSRRFRVLSHRIDQIRSFAVPHDID